MCAELERPGRCTSCRPLLCLVLDALTSEQDQRAQGQEGAASREQAEPVGLDDKARGLFDAVVTRSVVRSVPTFIACPVVEAHGLPPHRMLVGEHGTATDVRGFSTVFRRRLLSRESSACESVVRVPHVSIQKRWPRSDERGAERGGALALS